MHKQYCDLKFVTAEKMATGSIQTFSDLLSFTLNNQDNFGDISIL